MTNFFLLNRFKVSAGFVPALILLLSSCRHIDLFEKSATIPGHAWSSDFKPEFKFTIKDTASSYRLFVILRHNDRYNYNNIYINLSTKQPGQDSLQTGRYDLKLANEDGWLARGMDDIYEHRIALTPLTGHFYFRKPGDYIFRIEQIMRENPLQHILNVGLRIEKEK
jgi:gliding motility-associated lipoprotein GldH